MADSAKPTENPVGPSKWMELRDGTKRILESPELNLDAKGFMRLYQLIWELTTSKTSSNNGSQDVITNSEILHDRLKKLLVSHLEHFMKASPKVAADGFNAGISKIYSDEWIRFHQSAQRLNKVFKYSNRHYFKRMHDEDKTKVISMYSLCLQLWRQIVLVPMHHEIFQFALDEMTKANNENAQILQNITQSVIIVNASEEKALETAPNDVDTYTDLQFWKSAKGFYDSERRAELTTGDDQIKTIYAQIKARIAEWKPRKEKEDESSSGA